MSPARQRWRLAFSRGEEARFLSHLDTVKLWERAFRRGGIPIATTEGFTPRPRIVFAAPLPLGVLAERELVDLYLSQRLTVADLRERLRAQLPAGFAVVDLHDVWVGEPSVASRLVAADHAVHVRGARAEPVRAAICDLLDAQTLRRSRRKDDRDISYDLRPLVLRLELESWEDLPDGAARGRGTLAMRLRHDPEHGSGRPEEVVAALAEALATPLPVAGIVRRRVWLDDEARG